MINAILALDKNIFYSLHLLKQLFLYRALHLLYIHVYMYLRHMFTSPNQLKTDFQPTNFSATGVNVIECSVCSLVGVPQVLETLVASAL